ncbi:MAG TPA: DMT family transporter [Candidatus Deferrimicrobium sp.]|nr:DMT family transporter [Candidatus Deferrimicrobium sp.]
MAAWARSATGRAWLLLAALVIVWGCHWTVAKIGLQTIPPFTYGMLRLLVAMAVLAALMQGAGRLQRPARADVPIIVSYGLLAIAVGIGIMNLALPFVEAGRASILAYTLPLWVVPIVAVVSRTLPTRPEVTGLVLGLAGLFLLLNPAAIDWSSPQVLIGSALLLVGAMAGAAALVHVRAHRWQGTPFDIQIWQLLVAAVPMVVLAAVLERDEWAAVDWDLGTLLVILYSGALATAFAFWASQSIVRAIGPTTTSIGYLAVPVAGILTGVLVLGEPVGLLDMLGLVVTSAGIMVVLRAQRGSPAASPGTAAAGGNDETDRQLEVVLADGADLPAPGSGRR